MAQHAEPMDIDDEGDFDNKENTYQHSNVLAKTPCTEKGYEELDVSELNMKLRYSITPAASPMSKSMSHCLDNRQNNLTDESLNNTVINEYENNLTRSLNSTLNKTEVKSTKILPLQALPTDVDGNRSSVLRSLAPETGNDIAITVSNENEIDNLSYPSSSSSVAQTPKATTPTKEIPKNDGGSPIMRGLKSVLSMFRSSQSPIPPEEEDPKASQPVVSPANVPLPDSKPRAVASTPKSENNKEKSLSRRNSPHKESIVFNEDLEKELQWNDDSTIVFSTEKIPIHKLFFQDKPYKSLNENVQQEDANSTVEYMDVSYNDLSIKDRTLNGTVNKSKANELAESDGEFVDCETTFTQNEANSNTEVVNTKTNDVQLPNAPEKELVERVTTVVEPFTLDTTKDIINSIDDSHVIIGDHGKPLDFSTTDIVNQLSDLINESETSATSEISVKNKDNVVLEKHDTLIVSNVQNTNKTQTELPENQITSPVNIATDSSPTVQVSNENENLVHTLDIVCNTIVPHIVSVEPKNSLALVDADNVTTCEVASPMPFPNKTETTKTSKGTSENAISYPSPVDIPLPNDDDINDNLDENVCNDLQERRDTLNANTSQYSLMAALDKSIDEATPNVQHTQVESKNHIIACPPNLLPSDVPLPNKDDEDSVKPNIMHEAITVVLDPAQSPVTEKPDASNSDVINDVINVPMTDTTVHIPDLETKAGSLEANNPCPLSVSPNDIPLPGMDDDNANDTQDLAQQAVASESLQHVAEKLDQVSIENSTPKVYTSVESAVVKSADIDRVGSEVVEVAIVNTMPNLVKEEHMEISFVESNNKFSEIINMDVSMVDANRKVEEAVGQPELSPIDTQSFNVMPELPEIANDNIKSAVTDIVNSENLAQNQENELILNSVQLKTENKIVKSINKEMTSDTVTDKDLTVINESKPESSHLPTLPETGVSQNETKITVDNNAQKIEGSIIQDVDVPIVPDIVGELNTTNTSSIAAIVPTDPNEKENNIVLPHQPEGSDTTIQLDSTHRAESTPKCEEKTDEEIILSESNSPFVSMSAEEEFDPELKKDDFEKIDNPFSTESKVAQSPPISPKIVSKGYNFNFDEIDNINPFATKTKIRMSPPPGASPNNSLTTEKLNKTEIVEPLKSEKYANRRKSLPERKKPLKAKRHLNSSVDSTEKASPQATPSKNDDVKSPAKIQNEQEQPQLSQPKLNQHDISNVAPVKEEVNNDSIDVAIQSEIITHEDKVKKEPTPTQSLDHPKDETLNTEDKINLTQNNEPKVVEDVVMSASDKSPAKPDTSSSEQSTYFSAGASSTELTESKNVFNLPELDGSNPFATKSKMRQSPPRDFNIDNPFTTKIKIKSSPETSFVVTEKNCNNTVTTGNEEELKEANCSGSSKTSDEKDVTVHEVHTEDEDTLEGPFLEADDGNEGENISELPEDKVDVVDFDNIHQQDNDDPAEMFIDAEAFEFLMNQNKTDEVAYSGKESLFLKFDPLFARRVTSEGMAAALNNIKRKQVTPKKAPRQAPTKEVELLSFEKPSAGPSDLNGTYEAQSVVEERSDDMNVTASKPMMAVTPAVNPVVTPRKSLTPNISNRLSMTFTSPAMAVIDRLLSLSGNSPSAGLDTTVTHVDTPRNSETDQALTQLRELLAEKEIHVYNLRCETKELKGRLSTLETQMKALEAEGAERLKKVNELNENLAEKTKMNRNMAAVVEEYERTIASLISETEQDKKRFAEERNQLIRDRDEQTAHLASMEVSFNDLHSKYEKSKQVILGYKTNEEAYKKSIQEFEENLAKMHTNYELLKQHATSKLNHANQELEKINKAHEGEILKFNAMLKRKEVHITSLEESLAQKTKANEELTAICDELINKVG